MRALLVAVAAGRFFVPDAALRPPAQRAALREPALPAAATWHGLQLSEAPPLPRGSGGFPTSAGGALLVAVLGLAGGVGVVASTRRAARARVRASMSASTRRAVLASGAAAVLAPSRAGADTAVPTFSLKGVPGLSKPAPKCSSDDCSAFEDESRSFSLQGFLGGKEDPAPLDLGVYGRGPNKEKSGRLNRCDDPGAKDGYKKGCISTYDDPSFDSFVPAWTYQPGYSTQTISASEARRQAIRAEEGLEVKPSAAVSKTPEAAFEELKAAVQDAGGKVVVAEDRYLRAEFTEGGVVDDVEWLISLDVPICNYRSAPRRGGDDKRQRNRIRDIRKSLKDKGWKSVGRQLEGL